MKHILSTLFFLCLIATSLPLAAQFRRERNTASKEYELKAFNLAIENYKKALARRPSDLESLSRIADSYRMLNQMQTAHDYYQQAVRDKKVEANTVLEHAHVLKALSRYDEAKQWYLLYARDYDVVVGNHYAQSCDFAKAQSGVDAGFTNQSVAVNSPTSDFGATMPSPQQLVFNSARTPAGTAFDGRAKNSPYVASIGPDGALTRAFALVTGYNDPSGNIGPVSYTPDGREVVFTRNNFIAGTRMIPEAGINMTLMIADVNDQGGWSNARPLPFNGTDFSSGFGSFGADGNSIYFSSDRPQGYGGYDIYRVRRQGESWESVPENLGTVVNTSGHEITPSFDGASLFFSSNWHHGLGTYDVFRAEVSAGRPTALFHMGAGINSDRDDLGFVYDPVSATGYVTSNRIGGSGMEDVYRIARKSDSKRLLVQSSRDGSYLANVAIDFTACGGQVYATDENGKYVFEGIDGLDCEVVISKQGYTPVRLPIKNMQVGTDNEVRIALEPTDSEIITGGFSGPDTDTPVPGGPTPPGTYRGMVVNAQSGYPIPMANIKLTQRNSGASANVYTNVDGAYILALEPSTTYDLQISADGFTSVGFPIINRDGSDRNLLGTVTLLPGQSVTATVSQPTTTVPTTTTTPTNAGEATPANTTSGYSVQVASVRARPDLSRYGNLNNFGRVYEVNTGSAYKVRLGVFGTRAEAESAAKNALNAGYTGAFVVSDSGAATSGSTGPDYAPPATNASTTQSSTSGRYKVQLGAFGQPQNFNRAKAASLGSVETKMRGNLTLFMVGGITSVADAQRIKASARSMGYDGAFILEEVNGQLVKLR
ncbi:carboxypeptidase regulatory-like domain-containing protein [Neolewinella antarctica]|uniref:SPOR domain-containing protein n=1 Tax=Neolewinella antarctica TaxID=442734 RepID=A0ABX0X780_9BACT|nr:carboxypeptidase regulatory-like domain-containing protein [Neolewinella antarctica]NJC24723.1 hypothetical protein [Neolewinella antarctica]